MKKKLLSVVLGVTMAASLVLTACGNSANADNSASETTESTDSAVSETTNSTDSVEESNDDSLNQATSLVIGIIGNSSVVFNTDRIHGFVQNEVGDDVKVSYEVFQSGPEAFTALQSGSINVIAGNGAMPVATFGANNSEFVIVASTSTKGDSYIAARPGIGIESLEDLKGKQIGVPLGTGSHYLLLKKLEEVGLTVDDVELVNLIGPDLMAAYAAEEIDVMVNSKQLLVDMVDSGEVLKIAESDDTFSYVESNVDYAAANPEIVEKFILGLHNAAAYLDENKEDVIAEISEEYELDVDTLYLLYDTLGDTTYFLDAEEPQKQVEEYMQFALDNELIATDFDVAAYFDFSYSENAAKAAD